MHFRPRQVTWSCEGCTQNFKNEECVSSGKYCAPNHVRDDFNRIQGKDILEEDLRQSCIHHNLY